VEEDPVHRFGPRGRVPTWKNDVVRCPQVLGISLLVVIIVRLNKRRQVP
jgi:hypothetical protein